MRLHVTGHYKRPPVAVVERWLDRSAYMPLAISFKFPFRYLWDGEPEHLSIHHYFLDLFYSLRRYTTRWRLLTLHGEFSPMLSALPTSLHEATQLTEVNLEVDLGADKAEHAEALWDRLDTAPSLRRLRLVIYESHCIDWPRHQSQVKYFLPKTTTLQNLTHITIDIGLAPRSSFRFLRSCTSVVHLNLTLHPESHVGLGVVEDDINICSSPISLLHLRVLKLRLMGAGYRLLNYMECPNLEIFEIEVPETYGFRHSPAPLYAFLQNMAISLQVLVLNIENTHEEIIELFSNPRLYEISILEISIRETSSVWDTVARAEAEDAEKAEDFVIRDYPPECFESENVVGWIDKTVYEQLRWTLEDCGVSPKKGKSTK